MSKRSELIIPVLTPSHLNSESQARSPEVPAGEPDFVLVWNEKKKSAVTEGAFERRSVFEYNLEEEGLILDWETHPDYTHLHVVKIYAPLAVLKTYSEILKLRLPMKDLDLCKLEKSKDRSGSREFEGSLNSMVKSSRWLVDQWEHCTKCFSLDEPSFTRECRKLTQTYHRDREYLFDVDETNMYDIFPMAVRARIVQYILRRTPYKKGDALERDAFAFGYERLVQKGVYEAGYPLHDGSIKTEGCTRKLLYDNWGRMGVWYMIQPFEIIKNYFGVNIAIYFAWLGFYTRMLAFAAVVGWICFIYGAATISSDQLVKDVCNQSLNITMCPLCDKSCTFWNLTEKCGNAKFAHLFDNEFSFFFALFMSVWAALFMEMWKRYSARITHYWDLSTFDFKKDFNPRPEYVAELKKIYPHGVKDGHGHGHEQRRASDGSGAGEGFAERTYDFELTIPFWSRKLPFSILSYSAVLILIIMVLATLVGVILYRLWFTMWLSKEYTITKESEYSENGLAWQKVVIGFTAGVLNLTFIFLFGKIYRKLALVLTEMEYPRTQTEFDSSFALKLFLLQFINNYSSIFYVAFFKGAYTGTPTKYYKLFGKLRQEECGIGCMPDLCIQLAIIMIGKQSKHVITEAVLPGLLRVVKRLTRGLKVAAITSKDRSRAKFTLGNDTSAPQWLQDLELLDWGNYTLTDEYLDMVLQYGFVTIFVAAFPLAPFFALINNIIELRVDANKMLTHYKRPVGLRAKDIGIWSDIIGGIVKIAVISNACIIAFTSNFIPRLLYRFIFHSVNHPDFGTLNGYLISTLTSYSTEDLESAPDPSLLRGKPDVPFCYFQAYRYEHDSPSKYEFKPEHWQIWMAKVLFVLLYENLVNVIIIFVCWAIPDVPHNLRVKMQREERLINELIVKQEQLRSKRFLSPRHHHRSPHPSVSENAPMRPLSPNQGTTQSNEN